MGQVTITIDKREYAITCGDGQEAHIIKLSRILDEKAKMLASNIGSINENLMLAMVGLLLADELQELKSGGATSSNIAAVDTQKTDADFAAKIEMQTAKLMDIIKEIKVS